MDVLEGFVNGLLQRLDTKSMANVRLLNKSWRLTAMQRITELGMWDRPSRNHFHRFPRMKDIISGIENLEAQQLALSTCWRAFPKLERLKLQLHPETQLSMQGLRAMVQELPTTLRSLSLAGGHTGRLGVVVHQEGDWIHDHLTLLTCLKWLELSELELYGYQQISCCRADTNGPHKNAGASPNHWGAVTSLRLSKCELQLPFLWQVQGVMPGLTSLDMHHVDFVPTMNHASQGPTVEAGRASSEGLLQVLCRQTKLEHLAITRPRWKDQYLCKLNEDDHQALKSLKRMKHFKFELYEAHEIDTSLMAETLSSMSRLRVLDLDYWICITKEMLDVLCSLPNLTRLEISGVGSTPSASWLGFGKLRHLRALKLKCYNYYSSHNAQELWFEGLEVQAALERLRSLRRVEICGADLPLITSILTTLQPSRYRLTYLGLADCDCIRHKWRRDQGVVEEDHSMVDRLAPFSALTALYHHGFDKRKGRDFWTSEMLEKLQPLKSLDCITLKTGGVRDQGYQEELQEDIARVLPWVRHRHLSV